MLGGVSVTKEKSFNCDTSTVVHHLTDTSIISKMKLFIHVEIRRTPRVSKSNEKCINLMTAVIFSVPVPDLVGENLQAERNRAIGPIPTKIGVFAD